MENALDLARRLPATIRQDLPDGASPLATLRDIGRTLADTPHFKCPVPRALELLATAQGLRLAFVPPPDAETGELRPEAGYGFDPEAARGHAWRMGEGVSGRVAESGRPVVVTQAGREPSLRRPGGERPDAAETTFVCVPVPARAEAAGVLCAGLCSSSPTTSSNATAASTANTSGASRRRP